jgi:DNA-binding transcriptional MerR regulator
MAAGEESVPGIEAMPPEGAELPEPPPTAGPKSLTIGAVVKALVAEFPDISISKVRYLEDQKLLAPRRTPGGYRLYSRGRPRLRTILRLQRDEFLPLRVIRQELARARERRTRRRRRRRGGDDRARRARARRSRSATRARLYSLEDVSRRRAPTRAGRRARGLRRRQGRAARRAAKYYDETEREIVRAVTELARYGVGGRNLRVFRTSAEREAALLQQILAPGAALAQPERRKEAVEALENLAAVASHLKHLLLVAISGDREVSSRRTCGAHIRDNPGLSRSRASSCKDITPLLRRPGARARRLR